MVKATVRKPAQTLAAQQPVIDIEATRVDENSAEALAAQLEAGAAVPGSEEEAEQQVEQNRTTTLAARPPAALVQSYADLSGGGLEGDFDANDLKLPQLKLVNGSGELSQKYNQGTLLLADEKLWSPPNLEQGATNPSMNFVPIQVRKQFRENLTQDEVEDGAMPRTVDSRAAAEALTGKGSTEWVNGKKPKWSPSARCVFLLQAPDGAEHPNFTEEADGKQWALAVYYAGGTAYNNSAKLIFNAAQISLKDQGRIMLHKKLWTFGVVKKKAGNFMVFVPNIRLTKDETGPDVRALVDGLDIGRRKVVAEETQSFAE